MVDLTHEVSELRLFCVLPRRLQRLRRKSGLIFCRLVKAAVVCLEPTVSLLPLTAACAAWRPITVLGAALRAVVRPDASRPLVWLASVLEVGKANGGC